MKTDRKRDSAGLRIWIQKKKNKRREAAFVFLALLMSKRPMKTDRKRDSAGLRIWIQKKKNKRREAAFVFHGQVGICIAFYWDCRLQQSLVLL